MAISTCGTRASALGRELTEHGTALFPLACYEDSLKDAPVPWHWHEELEAGVVTEGRMSLSVGQERVCVLPGEGFFINAGVLHAARAPEGGGCRLRSLVFHARLVGGSLDSVFWQKYLRPLTHDGALPYLRINGEAPWHGEAADAIARAWQSCADEPPGYEFTARAELSRLIALLCAAAPRRQAPISAGEQVAGERVKLLLPYIQEHYRETITLAQLAQLAHVSESECLRCFRRVIGVPPGRFIKQFRLQQAAELLTQTEQTVGEVGAACGFEDAGYFIRAFREAKGVTPAAYRKRKS